MANFLDTFNRSDYRRLGNGWALQHQREGQVPPANAFQVFKNTAGPYLPVTNYVIAYRPNPYPIGTAVQIIWTVKGVNGYGFSNVSELFFRYDARSGAKRAGLYVKINGTVGQLRQRYQASTATTATDVVLATWARSDSLNYLVTVDISAANLVTVYDDHLSSGSAGTKAAEMTITTYAGNNGIGWRTGFLDQIQLVDKSVSRYADFDASDTSTRLRADLSLDLSDPAAGNYPSARIRHASLSIDPYVVIDGLPVSVAGVTSKQTVASTGVLTASDTGLLLDPTEISPGSTVRWLARPGAVTTNQWNSYSGGAANLYWTHTDAQDPVFDPDFIYASPHGFLSRPALIFSGGTTGYTNDYMKMAGTLPAAGTSWTFSMVAILRSGNEHAYEIFAINAIGANNKPPINVNYRHGQIYLSLGAKVLQHEMKRNEATPTIITLTVDQTTNTGRFFVQDLSRTFRRFSTKGLNDAPRFRIGTFTETPVSLKPHAQMDLFEANFWSRSLSDAEILRHNNELSHAYGVIR